MFTCRRKMLLTFFFPVGNKLVEDSGHVSCLPFLLAQIEDYFFPPYPRFNWIPTSQPASSLKTEAAFVSTSSRGLFLKHYKFL